MTKIDANKIGMELAFNPTNRHVQNVIFNKDVSGNENLLKFSNYDNAQVTENTLDITLTSIKTEPDYEPGEVTCKTEPEPDYEPGEIICKTEQHDWSIENSEIQSSTQTHDSAHNSTILQDLLSNNDQTEANTDSGLQDDLGLEPGESLIRLKLEPELISEIIANDRPPEAPTASCTELSNDNIRNGSSNNLGNVLSGNRQPEENADSLETSSVLQNVVPVLPGARPVSSESNVRKKSILRIPRATFIYRPIDAPYSHVKYSSKVIYVKDVPFAIEATMLNQKLPSPATPYHNRCKICGDSVFIDFDHFVDHLRHHNYSKMYCMICQKGLCAKTYAENHAEIHLSNQVECNECFQFFPTKEKLKSHKLNHKGKPPFRCDNCPTKFFLTFQQVKKHVRTCIGVKFRCNKCQLELKSRNELEKHCCTSVNLLECQKCLKVFESKEELGNHVQIVHKGIIRVIYNCKLCQNSYDSYHGFLFHRISHILEYSDKSALKKCQICQKNCKSINQLREHVKKHSQKRFHCSVCHIGYSRQKHVIYHLKVHELNYLQCHQCFYFYKSKLDLKDHERKHRMGPPFHCEHCPNLEFQHFNDIRVHITQNHLSFECAVCNKKFQTLMQLSNHKAIHEKKYFCDKCEKKFARVDYLAKHKTIHTKARAYKCPDCKHKFSRSDNFKVHLRKMHPSDKTYSCLCGAKFPHKVIYLLHKNQHRGGKFFYCEFCKGKFKKFTEIKKHVMIDHLKMTKYTCEVCKKHFLKHDNLRVHYDKRHKNLSSICDVCGKEFESYSKLKTHKDAHELEASETKVKTELKKRKSIKKKTGQRVVNTPPFECYHCKSSFKKIRLLKYHIFTKHLNAKEFACNLCEEKFLTLASLKNHYCISHNNENVICDKCGSYFKKYKDFLLHNRVHENGSVRECNKCEKKFSTAAELKRHYLNTHRNL